MGQPGMSGQGKANLSKKEIDDILKFGTEELFADEGETNEEGESANDIVYDDAAVNQLLDRSQEGIEEKESWANEYLSSFKVAQYQTKGGGEQEEDIEILKQEADNTDPAYWEKLLRHHYEQAQRTFLAVWGKGRGSGSRSITVTVEKSLLEEETETDPGRRICLTTTPTSPCLVTMTARTVTSVERTEMATADLAVTSDGT